MLLFGLALMVGGLGVLYGLRDEVDLRPRHWGDRCVTALLQVAALVWRPRPAARRPQSAARRRSEPVARRSEPVARRRTEPAARRVEPVARRSEPVARRRTEPAARRVEPVARRSEPVARRSEPVARRSESGAGRAESAARRRTGTSAGSAGHGIAPEDVDGAGPRTEVLRNPVTRPPARPRAIGRAAPPPGSFLPGAPLPTSSRTRVPPRAPRRPE